MKVKERVQEVVEDLLAVQGGLVRTHEVMQALAAVGFEIEFPIDAVMESLGFVVLEGFVVRENG